MSRRPVPLAFVRNVSIIRIVLFVSLLPHVSLQTSRPGFRFTRLLVYMISLYRVHIDSVVINRRARGIIPSTIERFFFLFKSMFYCLAYNIQSANNISLPLKRPRILCECLGCRMNNIVGN